LLAVGTCIINASQAGNTQYGQASWERSLVITLAPQTITFPAIPAVNYGAVPFAASAGASSAGPTHINVHSLLYARS
jgi:hypothetical protein